MDGSNRSRYLREEYLSRINRAIDHIDANLDKELRLEQRTRIANVSPYHFHRIFKAPVGEPLNQFIQRTRLKRAAARLIDQPKLSITVPEDTEVDGEVGKMTIPGGKHIVDIYVPVKPL